jgi:urocanate hydratase
MVIPNYSRQDDWEKYNALGVSQYGQMTAGSYMYIGPQGIVHGTTITVMNAARKQLKSKGIAGTRENMKGMLFVQQAWGECPAHNESRKHRRRGERNRRNQSAGRPQAFDQGWVDELHDNLDELLQRIRKAVSEKETVSLAYVGNVVDLWERLAEEHIHVDLGTDQTSLHNPWAGGYYPQGDSGGIKEYDAAEPEKFREAVQASLRRQVAAINKWLKVGSISSTTATLSY